MKVLVTGGAGYVGAHVAWALRQAGHEVVILDDLSTGHRSSIERLGMSLLDVDLRDAAATRSALAGAGFEACVHLAAAALVPECERDPAAAWAVNVVGGLNLVDAALAAGVRRFVITSSAAVYGTPDKTPITELAPRRPVSVYGRTKAALEDLFGDHARAGDARVVALRVFNVGGAVDELGLGEDHDPETHLIPRLLEMAVVGGGEFDVYGDRFGTDDGSAVRDYVHVMDVARAHLLALERTGEAGGDAFEVFNVGTGTGTSVKEMVSAVETETGIPITPIPRPPRRGDPDVLVADVSRARNELGFTATRSGLDETIRSAWAWLQARKAGKVGRLAASSGNGNGDGRARPAAGSSARTPAARSSGRTKRDSGRISSSGSGRLAGARRSPRFGETCRRRGYITEDHLRTALELQKKRDQSGESHKLLGIILLEMGAIDNAQLIDTLREMTSQNR